MLKSNTEASAVYLACTCRPLEGTWWWGDRGPDRTPDWRRGCDRTGDPDTLTPPSARSRKHGFTALICCVAPKNIHRLDIHPFIYLDSDWRSALCVLLSGCVWVCRGTQMLIRNTSSVESRQDADRRPGGTLDDQRLSFTSVSRVVLQDGVKIHWEGTQEDADLTWFNCSSSNIQSSYMKHKQSQQSVCVRGRLNRQTNNRHSFTPQKQLCKGELHISESIFASVHNSIILTQIHLFLISCFVSHFVQ